MAKPELGTKRVCVACGARFYDLTRFCQDLRGHSGETLTVPGGVERNALPGMWLEVYP